MKLDLDHCQLAGASQCTDTFLAVRERIAPVAPLPYRGRQALRHAIVECSSHHLVDGTTCERCRHFLDATLAPDGHSVNLRCVVFEHDAVETLMTRVCDLPTVREEETCPTAASRMRELDVDELLVLSAGKVRGLVNARRLAHAVGPVATHVPSRFMVVPRTMPLGAVAHLLRTGPDCLGVIDGDELVGLIRRRDLTRAGVPGM